MADRFQYPILALIVLIAGCFRFTGLDWDDYNHYHPDERFISWVGTTIEFPDSFKNAFDPRESSFNPFYWPKDAESSGIVVDQGKPRRFAYGHLPLYLGVGAAKSMDWLGSKIGSYLPEDLLLTQDLLNQHGWIEYRHLTAVGRALTALADTATIALIFFLGRQLFSPAAGLLAAGFLAVNVMDIQLAHFFTVDPYLTLFVTATVTSLVGASRAPIRSQRNYLILAAACIGLAAGAKFNAIILLVPLGLAVAIVQQRSWKYKVASLIFLIGVAFAVFVVTNPFAILDTTCSAVFPGVRLGPLEIPRFSVRSCYLFNLGQQGSMVRGMRDVPYVRQYIGTSPYLYFAEMQLRWGMGLLLGIAAFLGLIWAAWRVASAVRRWWPELRKNKSMKITPVDLGPNVFTATPGELLVLSWTLPYFLITGAFSVKFMRYLQPLIPFLMLYAAAMLLSIQQKTVRRVLIIVVLVATGIYALSFVNIYRQPHPWIEASRWIYENYDSDTVIVSEAWDDPLPGNLDQNGDQLRRNRYQNLEVNWLSGTEQMDDIDKIRENLELVADSDLLIIASNRNYGVIPRLPKLYPLSGQYYSLLFDGSLGFELMYTSMRSPNLFDFWLKPDSFRWPKLTPPSQVLGYLDGLRGISLGRFDESFTVYDQPLVMVFENKSNLTPAEMEELFRLPEP